MNINLATTYMPADSPYAAITDAMDEHLALLAETAGYPFTGRQALLPETDLPDAYRVWNETSMGVWVWVNPDGVIVESNNPMRYRSEG